MSSRHNKDHPFESGLPEPVTPHCSSASPGQDAAMQESQRASQTVLHLATQTHVAVARSDMAGAEAARMSLERQLALTTGLINALLFGGNAQPTTH